MQPTHTVGSDYSRLKSAYSNLSEVQKRRFSEVIAKHAPKLFSRWFKSASCKGFTERSAAARPLGVGWKMDKVILRSQQDEIILTSGTVTFFQREFKNWIDFINAGLAGATTETVRPMLTELLARPNAPFVDSDWKELFHSRAILLPEDWLDPETPSTGEVSQSLSTLVTSFKDSAQELRRQAESLQTLIDSIKAAQPFDSDLAKKSIEEIKSISLRVRQLAASEIGKPDLEQTPWDTLESLEAQVETAVRERASRSAIHVKRERLLSVADALKGVTRINMKVAAIRARAEDIKKAAISELEISAKSMNPGELPGVKMGREWLEEILQLEPELFESWILQLNKQLLENVGLFLAEVETFERLIFPESTAEDTKDLLSSERKSVPLPLIPSEQPNASLGVLNRPVGHSTEKIQQIPSTAAAFESDSNHKNDFDSSKTSGVTLAKVGTSEELEKSNETFVKNVTERSEEAVSSNKQNIYEPAKVEKPAKALNGDINNREIKSRIAEEGTILPRAGGAHYTAQFGEVTLLQTKKENVKNGDHVRLIQDYAKSGMWATCGVLVNRTRVIEQVPSEIFEILTLLPNVRNPAGSLAESIKKRLEAAGAPDDSVPVSQLVIWCAALVPVATLVSFTNAPAILRTLRWPERLQALHQLVQSVIRLAESVPHISLQLLRGAQPRLVWEKQMADIVRDVDLFEREARSQTILYQPATEVWKHLCRYGAFFELAQQLKKQKGGGDRLIVKELLDKISSVKSFHKLIQSIHGKIEPASKVRIEARAMPQFENKSEPLRHAALRWLRLAENVPQATNFASERVAEFKSRWAALNETVITAVSLDPEIEPVAKAAFRFAFGEFTKLVDAANAIQENEADPAELLLRELLTIPSLRFDVNGYLVGETSEQLDALSKHSGAKLTLQDSAATRIKNRDVVGAKFSLALSEPLDGGQTDQLRQSLQHLTTEMRLGIENRIKELRRQAYNARLSGIIGESDISNLETAFIGLEKKASEDDNLSEVEKEIAERSVSLASQSSQGKTRLLDVIRGSVKNEQDRDRLERLVSTDDVMTVHEYLARLSAGEKLPKEDGKNLQPFSGFTLNRQSDIGSALSSAGELDGLRGAIRTAGAFAGVSFLRSSTEAKQRDATWLEVWLKIKTSARAEQERVEIILSSLGFVVESVKVVNRGAVQISEAKVEPLTERSVCPIPKFGSLAAGSLTIRHLWKWVDEETLLQTVGETAQHSQLQVIFFYGRLSPDRRVALAKLSRAKRRSFLILDELLLAHLCCITEGRLGAFFRASTPFTFADPFVTASSLVPPEMFYGRQEELTALMSSDNGRCFVYGGRQLGKTALLREAERRFSNASDSNVAIWIDLLNHGIGREHTPSEIWNVVSKEFSKFSGSLSLSGARASQDEIAGIIETWLDENRDRRVLLLLDEADRFLEEDARGDFREARRLKGIMDRTSRRFKVVFAGLHNVQRTTRQANHPLAHLGDPINVGALSQKREWNAAFALASEPLTALGVMFTSADLVSRILAICNFYPGLIQQFCSRMWRRLLDRRVDGPPFLIKETDLDEVYQDPDFRQDIVGRFKLTLQLDPRYWHLAHIVALEFLESPEKAEVGYTSTELREYATDWWQEGFVQSSPDEFRSLLDEMCDLGVLKKVLDKYSFRNANILLLLGTRSDVEFELLSGPRQIVEYTPRSFRARRKRGDSYSRRPLTLSEESRLAARQNGVSFIAGSRALGIADVGASFADFGSVEKVHQVPRSVTSVELFERDLSYLATATRSDINGLVLIWISAQLKWNEDWHTAATNYCERLRSDKRFIRIVFEVSADYIWNSPAAWMKRMSDQPCNVWVLRKWTSDFIGPWLLDLGVPNAPKDVALVMERTGGWPIIAEGIAKQFAQNNDWRKAIEGIKLNLSESKETTGANFVGISHEAHAGLKLLRNLRQLQQQGEKIVESDIAAYAELLGVSEGQMRATLDAAEILAIIDRTDYNARGWDPVFEEQFLL